MPYTISFKKNILYIVHIHIIFYKIYIYIYIYKYDIYNPNLHSYSILVNPPENAEKEPRPFGFAAPEWCPAGQQSQTQHLGR